MPRWLLNVHVRNVWEQYLTHNPASYQTVFEGFLKLTGWEKAGVLTRADIARWENQARLEVGEPLKRVRGVHSILSDVSRDYNNIDSISDEFAKLLFRSQTVGKASTDEILQLEKHWFDNERVKVHEGTADQRELVFNKLDDSANRALFENIYAEINADQQRESSDLKMLNPFDDLVQESGRRLAVVVALRRLCGKLGLASTHDTITMIPQDRLLQTYVSSIRSRRRDLGNDAQGHHDIDLG